MSYHPVTPGIIAGNVYRVELTLPAGNNITVDQNYVKTNTLWNGFRRLDITLIVPAGATIGSASTSNPALKITGFDPLLHKVTLVVRGNVYGKGGAGGIRAANTECLTYDPGKGGDGGAGGNALLLENSILLLNTGVIGGGGGGNGGDGAQSSSVSYTYSCTLKDCNDCSGSKYGVACSSSKNCSDLIHNGCPRKRDGSCSGGAKRCIGCRGTYTGTCTGSYTQWCPENSGSGGVDGSGNAGVNGNARSTTAGLGAGPGLSIVGINRLLSGSVQGTLNGSTANS
jgi:hypothetical protein